MTEKLNWGIVGTGGIAADFVQALRESARCRVVHVVGSGIEKARALSTRWSVPRASATLDEMLADASVEAVYVASPHPFHEAHASTALRARKPVLCEKPMTMDASGTARLIAQARESGVFLMEAFHVPVSSAAHRAAIAPARRGHRRGAACPRRLCF